MSIKLAAWAEVLNVIYAQQVGLADDIKKVRWEELEDVVHSVPPNEKRFIGGHFNGHIGEKTDGYDITHGGFGFGKETVGVTILDFAIVFDLMIVNFVFKKKVNQLVTFRSGSWKPQIDYFLIRANHKKMCKDCKVVPSKL